MDTNNFEESFRDRLSTVTKEGKRLWIYAKKPQGKLYNYRKLLSYILLLLFFITPFIRFEGEPFLMMNILERKFILFGIIFWPQDSYLFALMMLSFIFFVILFTVVYGRIWCGWACPQTVLMEMVFRRIEYLIDGDAPAQKKLAQRPLDFDKLWRRVLKHGIFFSISLLVTNTLLAYFIGIEELKTIVIDNIAQHKTGFTAMILFSLLIYFLFTKFREQVCIIVCPYGRLQGALLDANSMVVSYDYKRGEPRSAKKSTSENEKTGDCVDCKLCQHVCPTGIDIRNGTQLECINCTACIDACNQTMSRVKKPTGLIRIASENRIAFGKQNKRNVRTIAYSIVLVGILTFFVTLFVTRPSVEATILRTPGMLYQEPEEGKISNLYNIKALNKTHQEVPLQIKLASHNGVIQMAAGELVVKDQASAEAVFFVVLNENEIPEGKFEIELEIFAGENKIDEIEVTFVGKN